MFMLEVSMLLTYQTVTHSQTNKINTSLFPPGRESGQVSEGCDLKIDGHITNLLNDFSYHEVFNILLSN